MEIFVPIGAGVILFFILGIAYNMGKVAAYKSCTEMLRERGVTLVNPEGTE